MKVRFAIALLVLVSAMPASAQVLQAPFDADYSVLDLGTVPSLPPPAGGLTFVPGDANTLLIGGSANNNQGKIYSIGVTRGIDGHISAFNGTATLYANAAGVTGGIDGGLAFGPGGVLFYTSYSDNQLGQIKPGSPGPDSLIALTSLTPTAIAASVGTLAFVPPGFAGAGRFKIVQYNSPGNWYDVMLAPNAGGTYDITGIALITPLGLGPEGVIYVKAGNPQFGTDSVLVSEYSGGSVGTYEIDAAGDPVPGTRRAFINGLTGAEGAVIDPETGDFLFSTFGGGNRVIAVRGFLPPPSTTSTTLGTTSTSTSTSVTTSTTTTTATTPPCAPLGQGCFSVIVCCAGLVCDGGVCVVTTTTTSLATSTTTTSTVPPGECGSVPAGATFASIACRLDALTAATTTAGPALGKLSEKLLNTLAKADTRLDHAVTKCTASDTKHAGSELKKVVRKLIQYSHKLRTRSAQKKIPAEVREPLAAEADAIKDDAAILRDTLDCPADAA